MNSNFEKAKKLTADWPEWKKDYQLTKPPLDKEQEQRKLISAPRKEG